MNPILATKMIRSSCVKIPAAPVLHTARRCATAKTAALLLSLIALGRSAGLAGSVPAPYEIGTWQGFRAAAITYTFDDSCYNQFSIAKPMFNQAGFKMTLFTVTSGGLFPGWSRVQSAAADGHEIASHTVTHANLSGLSAAQQTNELANSQAAINANVTNQPCVTLAYPYCAVGNEAIVSTYYIASRTCSGAVVGKNPANFQQISSFVCGSAGSIQTLQHFTNTANSAASQNGWAVFLIHGIDSDGGYSPLPSTVLQATVNFFSAEQNRFWVETFGHVVRYIKERNDASVVVVSSSGSGFTLQVTQTLDNAIYNYPITLRRPLPTNWLGAIVTQNNQDLGARIVTVNSTNFIMFDVVPNAGDVIITQRLSQVIVPAAATEGNGTLAGQGNILVRMVPTNDVVFTLTSSDTTEVTVPTNVVLLAGQTNAAFDLTIVEDGLVDGDQIVTITAASADFGTSQATIIVHNIDQPPRLNLTLPAAATEGDGTLAGQGSVQASRTPTNDVTVSLTSGDTSEVTVPTSVIIPAGQSNAVFDLNIVDDSLLDRDQAATITATATGYLDGQATITVHDNDTATLIVTLPASASEGAGTVVNAGRVSVATAVAAQFTVSLTSGNPSRLIVPATTTINNGQTSAVFNLTFVDNSVIEGPQTVSVSAHVTNWTDGSASMTILENDPLPARFFWSAIPSPQLIGEPFGVTLTAQDAASNTLNFNLAVAFEGLTPGTGPGTNTLLNSPSHEQSALDGDEYVLAHSFTPNANLVVTHVRHYFGDKVSIWTDSGLLLASRNVVSVPGTWVETALASPVLLAAGATYRLGVHENNVDYYWSTDLPGTFADGTIDQSWWGSGNAFPTEPDAVHWYFVDLRYTRDVGSIAVSPVTSGNFTNGLWSGQLAVLESATNVILRASAGTDHLGHSLPLDVLGTPRLAIAAAGNSFVLSWPVAAAGFTLEQAFTLPDWTAAPGVPSVVGDRYHLTNLLAPTNTLYRLKKP
jgi:peptidoglycan/xylan/chitin deacetylase (PgdA/CDA1 family)